MIYFQAVKYYISYLLVGSIFDEPFIDGRYIYGTNMKRERK
jgi:hypothetical protein